MLKEYYIVLYIVLNAKEQLKDNLIEDENIFEQEGIILTTNVFAVKYSEYMKKVECDLVVFEEATALSSVYEENNKQAKVLREIFDNSFKLLLTETPIKKI